MKGSRESNAGESDDEGGDELTPPEEITVEQALKVVEALEPILDDGDWWRIEKALGSRASERSEKKYEYTAQDWNVYRKFERVAEVVAKKEEYEKLDEVFG